MFGNPPKPDFIKKWQLALSIFFSPDFFITSGLTAASLYLSIVHKDNVAFSNIMAVSGSIFGGIAGAFFKDNYDKVMGKNILEKKGRSAYRNLQGISQQLCNIKGWITDFEKKAKGVEGKRNLEEIWRHISTIELNIESGIEDWRDIIPELKQTFERKAEIDKKYKDVFQAYLSEILENKKELIISKDSKKAEEIRKKINDLEKQVKDIRKETNQAVHLNGTFVEPLYNYINHSPAISTKRFCTKCGKEFDPDYNTIDGLSFCPNCRNFTSGNFISFGKQ